MYWDADQQKWVSAPPSPPSAPGAPHPAEPPGASGEPEVFLVPPPPPGPPPGPPAGPSHASVLAGVLTGIVLAGAIGTGVWALVRDDGDDDRSRGVPGASAPVTPGPTASYGPTSRPTGGTGPSGGFTLAPAPAPTPTPGTFAGTGFPDRFVRTLDPAGFRLDVPTGWTRSVDGASVFYRAPGGRSLIQVFTLNPPGPTPYDSLVQTRKYVSLYADYREARLARVGGAGNPAELEYTYTLTDRTTRHVIIHARTAPDGKQYALLSAGPAADRFATARVLQALVASFCPTGACTG
ncbi:hypothetical protein LE181_12465 [Streptomyces sp. SCA3-4]|uniref:hypothetical protein n=1 Tax=Streptomyces sichuanensis TaxID=2871810 RepID=UPI001CE29838|nr:hypothetical protein [Streptomyces sichuanensis]MCA6092970.1 hypothetical protein [Streptomyces sichuanensis]